MATDAVVVSLRFLHILGAVAWVGGTFFWLAVLDPMFRRIPPQDAGALGRNLALRSKLAAFFPVAALLTVGAGVALMVLLQDRIDALTPMGKAMFHAGTGAGVLALVPGVMSGLQSSRMRRDARAFEARPDPALAQSMAATGRRLSILAKISAALLMVALFGMATFRYWA